MMSGTHALAKLDCFPFHGPIRRFHSPIAIPAYRRRGHPSQDEPPHDQPTRRPEHDRAGRAGSLCPTRAAKCHTAQRRAEQHHRARWLRKLGTGGHSVDPRHDGGVCRCLRAGHEPSLRHGHPCRDRRPTRRRRLRLRPRGRRHPSCRRRLRPRRLRNLHGALPRQPGQRDHHHPRRRKQGGELGRHHRHPWSHGRTFRQCRRGRRPFLDSPRRRHQYR